MTFWIITAFLVVVAVAWLAPTLLRSQKLQELDRRQQNIAITRERLDEMAAEHASGEMTDDIYARAREELEASLIDDVSDLDHDSAVAATQSSAAARLTLLVSALFIALGTLFFYQQLGTPQYLAYAGPGAGQTENVSHMASEVKTVDELVTRLQQKLDSNPNDAEGWFLLGRSYMSLSRYADAVQALEKAHEIIGDHPAVLVGIADAEAMTRDGNLTGRPSDYIDKALELEPDNQTALWLGGMASHQNGMFQQAIDRWSALLPQLEADQASQQQVHELIQEAVAQAKQAGVEVSFNVAAKAAAEEPTPSVAIKAWVSLDDAVASKVQPQDTVFIFAKAASGPPMPLAAFKTTVADLPMEVTLDDSLAMMPQMKLSAFEQVVVSARISKSGQPMASAGDLSSDEQPVTVDGTVAVNLSINKVVE